MRQALANRETDAAQHGSSIVSTAKEMGMQQAHISALELKHADIEARILEESQRPLPDMGTLSRLKKEKLKVKEAIVGLH
ncbi:MAG TPA: DUF465 domain-containing protein [Allosphingosinicella sp.]|nr:DUF465 domain-containing protein [Allosphingosinicella sp.]